MFQGVVSPVLPHSNPLPLSGGKRTQGFFKSFGGRLAQIRAMQACNPERRAWSSAEELNRGKESDLGGARPCRLRA